MKQGVFYRLSPRNLVFLCALLAALFLQVQVPRWAEARLEAAIAEAASQNPERAALKKLKVVLDAGHGGMDGGTAGYGVQEKDATLDLARRVEIELRRQGIKVRMTRQSDVYVELEDRCAVAAKSDASAFVSIHLNASTTKSVAGIETYFSSQRSGAATSPALARLASIPSGGVEDRRAEMLAGSIQRRVCDVTGAADRAVRDSRLFVVMHAACPAVLVECGYLTNADEARRLKSDRYRDKLALAIADGIRNYLVATSFNPRRGFSAPIAGRDVVNVNP